MDPATASPPPIDVERIREWFPSLASGTIFLENAGGSQVPGVVADAIRDYMLTSYVQLGAGYPASDRADAVVEAAHAFIGRLVNSGDAGSVVLGPSCSQLSSMLSGCYAELLEAGDEIVVMEAGHEANIGPWLKLADRGVQLKWWRVDPESMTSSTSGLESLLSPRTRIVAVAHVSNLLGEILDLRRVCDLVHAAAGRPGRPARVVADGVAYAPHRAIDVLDWGVDWYLYSTYKVYGPHMAALFGRHEAIAELTGPNHFFIPKQAVPYKFELGGVNHEGCAGLCALQSYLAFLAGGAANADRSGDIGRPDIEAAYATMTALERPLQTRLIRWLEARSGVRIVGPAHTGAGRVGTISFVHERRASRDIAAAALARDIGIRNGHMYAHRLCEALGIDPEDGVVRISLLHYNTLDEIDRLIETLDPLLV